MRDERTDPRRLRIARVAEIAFEHLVAGGGTRRRFSVRPWCRKWRGEHVGLAPLIVVPGGVDGEPACGSAVLAFRYRHANTGPARNRARA